MRNLRETKFEMRVARQQTSCQRCKQWKTASYVPNLTDSTNLANRSLRLRNLI
jgi:hypothetical protein